MSQTCDLLCVDDYWVGRERKMTGLGRWADIPKHSLLSPPLFCLCTSPAHLFLHCCLNFSLYVSLCLFCLSLSSLSSCPQLFFLSSLSAVSLFCLISLLQDGQSFYTALPSLYSACVWHSYAGRLLQKLMTCHILE